MIEYILVSMFLTIIILAIFAAIKDYFKKDIKNSNLIEFKKIQKKLTNSKYTYTHNEIVDIATNKINNRQFEYFCAFVFEMLGHKAVVTSAKNDKGKDIILDDGIGVVECKQYTTSVVGREICQKLLGAGMQSGAKDFFVVTTGKFNNNAYELSRYVENLKLLHIRDIISDLDKSSINIALEKTLQIS